MKCIKVCRFCEFCFMVVELEGNSNVPDLGVRKKRKRRLSEWVGMFGIGVL